MDERWSVDLKCPKCGTSYADAVKAFSGVSQGPAVKYVAPPVPGGPPDVTEHLRVTCLFCGYARDIACSDAPGAAEPSSPPRTGEDLRARSGPGTGPPPEPPGVNETPASGAFAHDRNVKTTDVPMEGGKGHMGPESSKKSK